MLEDVIRRVTANVQQRLAGLRTGGPVYAVALMLSDEGLFDMILPAGCEQERRDAIASPLSEYDTFIRVWNAYEFALEAPYEPCLDDDAEFLVLARRAIDELGVDPREALSGEEPESYILNRVAAIVTREHPLASVTDDFVVYAWTESSEEWLENLRFSATPDAARLLRERHLLPDDLAELRGFVDRRLKRYSDLRTGKEA